MTVQAGIESVTDLEVLVGEMPVVPCEHSQHGVPGKPHSDEPASHYMQCICDCASGYVYAACPKFVEYIASDIMVRCSRCGTTGLTTELVLVLAPINSSTR